MSVKSRYSTSLAPTAECREAYVRLGPSDCVLLDQTGVYDGGWLQDSGAGSPCLSEYWVDLFCAPLPGAACVLFRHSSILCSSLDAWSIASLLHLSFRSFSSFSQVTGNHPVRLLCLPGLLCDIAEFLLPN